MKNKLLIIIGSLLFFIALMNSIIDLRSLFDIDFNNFTIEIKNSFKESNFATNYLSNSDLPNNSESIIVTAPSNLVPDEDIESNLSSNSDIDGFLPLQLEKVESSVKPTPTNVVRIKPTRIVISKIALDAPIIQSKNEEVEIDTIKYIQWFAPDEFALGWQTDSAYLGEKGNIVLNGHHNVHGEVLKDLEKVEIGDRIVIYGKSDELFSYIVTNVMILPERDVPLEQRLENARWMLPTIDERLTVITCWPYYSNTHRLIVVARPETIEYKGILH